jgi:hypothetical protein
MSNTKTSTTFTSNRGMMTKFYLIFEDLVLRKLPLRLSQAITERAKLIFF